MTELSFSQKGQQLIELYKIMAQQGYDRVDKQRVNLAFSDFELRAYRQTVLTIFNQYAISSVLDYGCGGSDWQQKGFDQPSNQSAVDYFKLNKAYRYEPARAIDQRQTVDCVVSFDVLEHIFIADIPLVLRNIFSYANKLVLLNIACYSAAAKLPNGENAHVTVRQPSWWKGMLDSIAIEYPNIWVCLICSTGWRKSSAYPIWKANDWQQSDGFVINN